MTPQTQQISVRCDNCGKKYRLGRETIGKKGKCACGTVFSIAEIADSPLALADEPAGQARSAAAGAMCHIHPAVAATATCSRCWTPVCDLCAMSVAGGMLCPNCVNSIGSDSGQGPPVLAPVGPLAAPFLQPAGVNAICRNHPEVQAVRFCSNCRAPICATCDFALPGGLHLCPTCATTPTVKLTSGRKTLVVVALGLATWSTLGLALIFSGAFQGTASTKRDEEALGIFIGLLVGLPAIVGGALGLACMDKRQGNPPIVWVTAIWSGLLLAVWVLLCIIGAMK